MEKNLLRSITLCCHQNYLAFLFDVIHLFFIIIIFLCVSLTLFHLIIVFTNRYFHRYSVNLFLHNFYLFVSFVKALYRKFYSFGFIV